MALRKIDILCTQIIHYINPISVPSIYKYKYLIAKKKRRINEGDEGEKGDKEERQGGRRGGDEMDLSIPCNWLGVSFFWRCYVTLNSAR